MRCQKREKLKKILLTISENEGSCKKLHENHLLVNLDICCSCPLFYHPSCDLLNRKDEYNNYKIRNSIKYYIVKMMLIDIEIENLLGENDEH